MRIQVRQRKTKEEVFIDAKIEAKKEQFYLELKKLEEQKDNALRFLAVITSKLTGQQDALEQAGQAKNAMTQIEKLLAKGKDSLANILFAVNENRAQNQRIQEENIALRKHIAETVQNKAKAEDQLTQAREQYQDIIVKLDEAHRQYTNDLAMAEAARRETAILKADIQRYTDERELARQRLQTVAEMPLGGALDEKQAMELRCGPNEEVRVSVNSTEKKLRYYIAPKST